MIKTNVLPAITTFQSDWRAKIKEIDDIKIEEIALFPTVLNLEERKEYYDLISKTGIKSIPHVHIRDDYEEWELDFLSKYYNSKVFNTHANPATPALLDRCSKYRKQIFIENCFVIDKKFFEQVELCGGICIDFSHWCDARLLKWRGYEKFTERIDNYKVGCSHASAILKFPYKDARYGIMYNDHEAKNVNDYDYLKEYLEYIPDYVSIELTNPLSFQMEVKNYLEKRILNI